MTEDVHKVGMIFQAFLYTENACLNQLSLKRIFGNSGLNYVCTIEAVHTV